jgi:hypothetical protein
MTFDYTKLTWTCHVCKRTRPDERISVHQKTVNLHGAQMTCNIRYCNDRPECIAGAPGIDLFEEEAE